MNPKAIAWQLSAPGANSRKYYEILVVDNYLVVGWGARTARQFKIQQLVNAAAAQQVALAQTIAKEKGDYSLSVAPRWSTATDDAMLRLAAMLDHRGASEYLRQSIRAVLNSGTPLEGPLA